MSSKTVFSGASNPNFRVYILSQAVKHKSFPYDKNRRKYADLELEEQMIFLRNYCKNVA
jgi:hypothetical protein